MTPSRKEQLLQPVDAYRAIIDELVTEISYGVSEKLLAEKGIYSKALDDEAFNSFARSLSTDQRDMLAKILHAERVDTIHGVLAALTWWLKVGGVGLTFRGESMPVDLSGMGLHGDYIGRQHGWEWPRP
jgi:hypothetical protein